MLVYMLINQVDGKKYVGLTTCALEKRLREHKCAAKQGNNKLLYKAIRKHGWDNFRVEVLALADSTEELQLLEIQYITMHQTTNRQFGYNLTTGGGLGYSLVTPLVGSQCGSAKATEEVAVFIRTFDVTQPNRVIVEAIRERFGLSLSRDCVRDIRRGDSFKHLDREFPPVKAVKGARQLITKEVRSAATKLQLLRDPEGAKRFRVAGVEAAKIPKSKKLTEAQVIAIFQDPRPGPAIAREYRIDRSLPNMIRRGRVWGYVTNKIKGNTNA